MFKFRIIGFILLMALLGGIFFWDADGIWLFIGVTPAFVAAAAGECCSMLDRSGRKSFVLPAALAVWLLAAGIRLGNVVPAAYIGAVILFGALLIAGCGTVLSMKTDNLERLFNSAAVVVLLVPSFILLLQSYFLPPAGYWLIFLCLVTKATDTGGYIVGTLTAKLPGGNHKIAPQVSPKKSWEGLIGGMLLSLAVSWAFYAFGSAPAALWWHIVAAVVLSLGSFFGDLTESAIKRLCNIKDSGSFVPGMGGAFDVLDSFIYNGLLFWPLFIIKDLF